MAPTLTALKSDYQLLFDSCLIGPSGHRSSSSTATQIRANRARYESVGDALGVPWYVVGADPHHGVERQLLDPPPQRRPALGKDDARAGRPPEGGHAALHVGGERDRRADDAGLRRSGRTGASRESSTSSRPTTAGATASTTPT